MSLQEAERRRRQRQRDLEDQNDNRVLSFAHWCELNGFSLSTGRRILASGTGPRVLQLSARRIGIKVADNRAWQASRSRVA
jgi:predicted DNA-binding transcriptional regulator AlpA